MRIHFGRQKNYIGIFILLDTVGGRGRGTLSSQTQTEWTSQKRSCHSDLVTDSWTNIDYSEKWIRRIEYRYRYGTATYRYQSISTRYPRISYRDKLTGPIFRISNTEQKLNIKCREGCKGRSVPVPVPSGLISVISLFQHYRPTQKRFKQREK